MGRKREGTGSKREETERGVRVKGEGRKGSKKKGTGNGMK